eukprot:Pgem_evm1s18409
MLLTTQVFMICESDCHYLASKREMTAFQAILTDFDRKTKGNRFFVHDSGRCQTEGKNRHGY